MDKVKSISISLGFIVFILDQQLTMKFVFAVIGCSIVLVYLVAPTIGFLANASWSLVKYAFDLLINGMVIFFILTACSSICWSIAFVYKQIRLFQAERANSAAVMIMNDAIWAMEVVADVPGQSGDHPEFFDIPEHIDPEIEASRETRRRRQRMVSTLLRESSRDPSRERRRHTIEESLRESEDLEFRTPLPSPRCTQNGPKSLNCIQQIDMIQRNSNQTQSILDVQNKNKIQAIKKCYCPEDTDSPLTLQNEIETSTTTTSIPTKSTLHQFPRGITKPSLSCDGMFVETYIRLIGIACEVSTDCVDKNGPWMQINDNKAFGVKDCIKCLKQSYPDTTNMFTVNGERSGTSWSLTLLVDHLYMGLTCWRWVVEDAKEFITNQPGWDLICQNRSESLRQVKEMLWVVGFGKMSFKGVTDAILKDLETLSEILDLKSFLLGDTPTEVDCYAFSVLCQIEWGEESVLRDRLRDSTNVQKYCIRVKSLLWPDWDDHLAIVGNKLFIRSSDIENIEKEEHNTLCKKKPSKTHFTKSYYHLLPVEEGGLSENETEEKVTNSCACDDNLVYICTRCTTTEITTIRTASERIVQYSEDQHKATGIRLDGDMIHSYGIEEYFDDDFKDMERISYMSDESI